MYHETHQLREEFPDAIEKLQVLMVNDDEFLRLAADYSEINRKIIAIEHEQEHSSDLYLEELKKKRLILKDQVAVRLRN